MKKSLYLFLLCFILNFDCLFGMSFQVTNLVSITGNNTNFDILQNGFPYYESNYICWQNQNDSTYTIYLKDLTSDTSGNIIVYSDTCPNINPQVAINRFSQGIKIVWQSQKNDHWQLLQRNFNNDSLSQIILITDSLSDNINPSLSIHRVAYINDGKLMIRAFYPECEGYSKPFAIDSGYCSNPDIINDDSYYYTSIIYEKGLDDNKDIYKAEYTYNTSNGNYEWEIVKISNNTVNNLNPKFSVSTETASYQFYEEGFWRIIAYGYGVSYSSSNSNCNYCNPYYFCYDIPIGETVEYTPFFCVFDSDSLDGNQEVFIKTFTSYPNYTMNISNLSGLDEKPIVTVVEDSLTVIWEHTENNKTDIWWAKDLFNSYPGGAIDEKDINNPSTFLLHRNYPNPFNPSTVISFKVNRIESKRAVIKIYNSIGELVRIVSKDINVTGNYSITWDGKSDAGRILPTGNYFYSITYGSTTRNGKMCLIK